MRDHVLQRVGFLSMGFCHGPRPRWRRTQFLWWCPGPRQFLPATTSGPMCCVFLPLPSQRRTLGFTFYQRTYQIRQVPPLPCNRGLWTFPEFSPRGQICPWGRFSLFLCLVCVGCSIGIISFIAGYPYLWFPTLGRGVVTRSVLYSGLSVR